MIALALALVLYVPADVLVPCVPPVAGVVCSVLTEPNDGHSTGAGEVEPDVAVRLPDVLPTVSDPPVVLEVLPESTTPAPSTVRPSRDLARTGVPVAPYLEVSAGMIGLGVLLRRVGHHRCRIADA
jgi:hypothetical protein